MTDNLGSLENEPRVTPSSDHEALSLTVIAECSSSKARTSIMRLPHYTVELPMFMPVGTQGTLKGLLPDQLEDLDAQIILGNTYHLGMRPGKELFEDFNGLHNFMGWKRALLTDSGGFQMVSLLELAEITEKGVKFKSPYDGRECMLTPEESIHIQNCIGADIIMQLDDVVDVTETNYERFKLATERTTRWLDRCIKANVNPSTQNIFPIVQGGLYTDLRKQSLEGLIARDAPGYAIGGLSGGEEKQKFWPVVDLCTDHLPKNKPRYCMGVGAPVDLVVCCALGVDMFDCVYPTRTARFGFAIVDGGQMLLKSKQYKKDFRPIDESCECMTCQNHTRAYLNTIVNKETVGCHLLSIHNIAYIMRLMKGIRKSIEEDTFPLFVRNFMSKSFKGGECPQWVIDALNKVHISLDKKVDTPLSPNMSHNSPEKIHPVTTEEGTPTEEIEEMGELLLSDFANSRFDRGYREAFLRDLPAEVEERGKGEGFRGALEASGFVGMGLCEEGASSRFANSSLAAHRGPLWHLSHSLGILLACQSKKKNGMSPENVLEFDCLKADIRKSLAELSSPGRRRLDVYSDAYVHDSEPALPNAFEDEMASGQRCDQLLSRARKLCEKWNWKSSV